MLIAKYVIPLDPRTKKNHQMIAGSGPRCPVCRKPAKQFVRQGKAHTEYAYQALQYLNKKPAKIIETPVHVQYLFYMGTHRVVDKLNLEEAADDLLIEAKIIHDDNSRIVKSHDGSRVLYDKENPRTEIYIYDYKEEDDVYLKDIHG